MLVFRTLEDVKKHGFKNSRLTIGRFQGVHLGHQSLVSHLGEAATNSPKVILTFDPPPEDVLVGKTHLQMMTVEQKIQAFRDLGVDVLFFIPFSRDVAQLSATEFARTYILEPFSPKLIVIGYDFAFGQGRQGSVHTLRSLMDPGAKVVQLDALKIQNHVVSTSLIRQRILEGDVAVAKIFLGRPYAIQGLVIHGYKRGRTLGFPTMNLQYGEFQLLPQTGVYAVNVDIEGRSYHGVCNVGNNPTFSQDNRMNVECHILDFDRDIYDQTVSLSFFKKMRDEMRFSSKEDLVVQIQKDIAQARAYFLSLPNG